MNNKHNNDSEYSMEDDEDSDSSNGKISAAKGGTSRKRTGRTRKQEQDSSQNPNSTFACHDCRTVCKTRKQFNDHIATHEGYLEFKCSYCEKRCKESCNIKRHERTHTGERPFKCDFVECDQTFTANSSCIRHKRIHTGETPYECSFCGKKFISPYNCKRHERIHTGEKPYVCNFCDRRFGDKSSLNYHHRSSHSGNEPYSCTICKQIFSTRGELVKHKEEKHANDGEVQDVNQQSTPLMDETMESDDQNSTSDEFIDSKENNSVTENEETEREIGDDQPLDEKVREKKHAQSLDFKLQVHTHIGLYLCLFCNISFSTREELMAHKDQKHKNFDNRDNAKQDLAPLVEDNMEIDEENRSNTEATGLNGYDVIENNEPEPEAVVNAEEVGNIEENAIEVKEEDIKVEPGPSPKGLVVCPDCRHSFSGIQHLREHRRHSNCSKPQSSSVHAPANISLPTKISSVVREPEKLFQRSENIGSENDEDYIEIIEYRVENIIQPVEIHSPHLTSRPTIVNNSIETTLEVKQQVTKINSVVREEELIQKATNIEAESTEDLIEIKEERVENIIHPVEVHSPRLSSRPPVVKNPAETTLEVKHQEKENTIALNVPSIEYSPMPVSTAVMTRSLSHPKELMIVWSSKLDEDLLAAVCINPLQTILCVKNLQKLQLPERDEKSLKKSKKVLFYMMDTDDKCSLWTVISFGDQHPPVELEDQLFRNFKDVEKIFADHAEAKGMTLKNIMRFTDDLFQILAQQLSTQIMAFNYSEGK